MRLNGPCRWWQGAPVDWMAGPPHTPLLAVRMWQRTPECPTLTAGRLGSVRGGVGGGGVGVGVGGGSGGGGWGWDGGGVAGVGGAA